MFLAVHCPDWSATEPSWGKDRPSGAGMLAKSPSAYTPGWSATVRSCPTSIRPPRPWVSPALAASGAAMIPPPQITQWLGIVVPSESTARSSRTSLTEVPSRSSTPSRCRTLAAYSCALSENGASTVWARSTRITRACRTARSWYSCGMTSRIISASAPAVSVPVAPAPTITKLSAPRSTSEGSRSASSNSARIRERSRSASSSE